MGTTTNYGYPYPEASDPPAGHTQIQALAEAIDAETGAIFGQITKFQFGTAQIPKTGDKKAEGDVTFPTPFRAAGFTPVVLWSLVDNGFPVHVTINQITPSGFHVLIMVTDGVTSPPAANLPGSRTLTYVAIGEQT